MVSNSECIVIAIINFGLAFLVGFRVGVRRMVKILNCKWDEVNCKWTTKPKP